MSTVTALPPLGERIPERSPYLHDTRWLISLCARDPEMVLLMRHLHRHHNVVSIADLDAVGWRVVNTYPGPISPAKLDTFFKRLGKKRAESQPGGSAKIVAFTALRP